MPQAVSYRAIVCSLPSAKTCYTSMLLRNTLMQRRRRTKIKTLLRHVRRSGGGSCRFPTLSRMAVWLSGAGLQPLLLAGCADSSTVQEHIG
eukprot:3474950-Amphidinium_carterae.1